MIEQENSVISESELTRYARQVILFGKEGQESLKKARVFIAGAGGLGCPIALYLVAAGVGHIRLVDNDQVDLSNLNRQILHWEKDLGRRKCDSAVEKLKALNSDVILEAFDITISDSNADELVDSADIIVDAMDNFDTRYILNHVALCNKIPLVHGAVRGFDGQVTTIVPEKTACLRCIFPMPPPPEVFPVIGVTPGIIGLIQANEVLKFLLRTGRPLENRLLIWNGLDADLETITITRDPCCEECGEEPSIRK
ncbi:MAG: HesA/MoeB/ThiF family protein [Methanoregulaceae archaeon]|nr:HesA/MoeB/ThiF family protein [Methanoregulaceae archaeon]